MIFTDKIDEIDSFDAYYKNVVFRNNNIVIPYVNLAVSNHPLNTKSNLIFIDYAYMVFENVKYLDVFLNNRRYKVIDQNHSGSKLHFGGTFLDFESHIYNDMAIDSERTFLQTLDSTKLSEGMWQPVTLDNYIPNMSSRQVEDFFNNGFLPDNIRDLIK